jgi:hypothetical protein
MAAEDLLDLARHGFDGGEVGEIGRQIQEPATDGLDGLTDSQDFVGRGCLGSLGHLIAAWVPALV